MKLEDELFEEFSRPIVLNTPDSRIQLTLTQWEVRELVRRAGRIIATRFGEAARQVER